MASKRKTKPVRKAAAPRKKKAPRKTKTVSYSYTRG